MPVCYGRGRGVSGVTSWVALWAEVWCSMPVCYGRGLGLIRVTSWVAFWTEDPPKGQHSRASYTLCTRWGSMPMRGGRGSGVIRLTSWVVLWTEDWLRMLVRYGTGCGVIGVTSWVAFWTEVLCVCWSNTSFLHESQHFIQHCLTPIIPPCIVNNPHCRMEAAKVIVRDLWAKGGATLQQVTAIVHGHLHVICEMPP